MRFRRSGGRRRSSRIRRGTVKVQGVVEGVLHKQGWSDKISERNVFNAWELVVGKDIAAQSKPVSLSGRVLRVEVAHPVYANELSVMKTEILSKLEDKLEALNLKRWRHSTKNKVVDIQFQLNPNVAKVRTPEKAAYNRTKSDTEVSERIFKSVSPEMSEQIEAAVSTVNDFELRDSLKKLFLTQCGDTKKTD